MAFTENLDSLMVEEGNWGKHLSHEEQNVALTSEIKLLKSQANSKKNNPNKTNKSQNSNSGDGKGDENANKKNEKKDKIVYADWMLKAPTGSQAKSKTVGDKQYWWCQAHARGPQVQGR